MSQSLLCAVTAALFTAAAIAGDSAKPSTIFSARSDETKPLFVSRTAAVDERGQFRAELLPSGWNARLEQFDRAARRNGRITTNALLEPCGGVYADEPLLSRTVDRSTMALAVENAVGIYSGRVGSLTPGFLTGNPVSLLELTDVTAIKASHRVAAGRLRVTYPFAYFSAGGREFCSRSRTNPYSPAVGDRVIVFIFDAPVDRERGLVTAESGDVVFENGDGLFIPKELQFLHGSGTSLDGVAGAVRRSLESGRRGGSK